MVAFAESIEATEGSLPPYWLTIQNTVRDTALNKKMDPVVVNHIVYVPVIGRIVLETWSGAAWVEHRIVWKRMIEFLLHYYGTTTFAMFNKNKGLLEENIYGLGAESDIYNSDNYVLATILAITEMFDTAFALRCEKELVQTLTMAAIGSSARDRHYHLSSIGK